MKFDCLSLDYTRRTDVPQFDDTQLKGEWQAPVYIFARGLYGWCDCGVVIDVGCGSAYKLTKLFPHDEAADQIVIGVESNPETLAHLKRNPWGGFWCSNEQLDGFICEAFNDDRSPQDGVLAICSDVIEHVEDPVAFFEWLLTIPWKNMVISTPVRHPHEFQGPPGNIHHTREWAFDEFYGFLTQWGDQINVKLHCLINPEQRTQMAWLERKSPIEAETESPSGDCQQEQSGVSSLDAPSSSGSLEDTSAHE